MDPIETAHNTIPYLREVLIFLTAAGILVPLFQRFKISPVLGFLIAGTLLGPHGAGLLATIWPLADAVVITESAGVHMLAEMGILFLLFMIGLELSFERLSSMKRKIFGMGSLQVLLSAGVIGMIAYFFGNAPEASVLLGLGLALSSTAIIMQLLAESKRMGSRVGRNAFAVLLFQDLSVVLILFMVGFLVMDMSGTSDTALFWQIATALLSAGFAIVVIIVIGRIALRPMFNLVGKNNQNNKELFMAATLLVFISAAAVAEAAGLSMALGAFLAGLLLAETEYRHDIEVTVEPFKGLLLGLFFMSIGMGVDVRAIFENPIWIPLSVAGLFIIKASVLFVLARAFKISRGNALELGILLGGGGEFAFVVIAMGSDSGIMSEATVQFMLIVTTLSMMVTPFAARLAYRLHLAVDGPDESLYGPAAGIADSLENHVVMAGFGRMGRLLSDVLAQQQISAIAVEKTPLAAFSNRVPILQGDATDEKTLIKAGLKRAIALAVLIDKQDDAKEVIRLARELKPGLLIVARARDGAHAAELTHLGATATIPDVIEGSLHVAHALLTHIGVPEDTAQRLINQQRAHEAHMIETLKA
ncbi:MAG TPA: cation:proton antiporter [Alphaproteobacteria bacterium]